MATPRRTGTILTKEEAARVWQCGTCKVALKAEGDLRRCPLCGRFANVRYLLLREQLENKSAGEASD
jgi:hypothetical protein